MGKENKKREKISPELQAAINTIGNFFQQAREASSGNQALFVTPDLDSVWAKGVYTVYYMPSSKAAKEINAPIVEWIKGRDQKDQSKFIEAVELLKQSGIVTPKEEETQVRAGRYNN